MNKIDGLHQLVVEVLTLGFICLIIRLVITPIERHRTLNVVDENMIEGITEEGYQLGTFACCVNWYIHGDLLL